MTNFGINTAVRKATPVPISIWGPSSCGKTLSALLVARGLVGPEGKIGLVDTENRRAEIYANEAGGWDHLDFQPPFTPDRYTEAFKEFEAAGRYGCVIVDSTSHVWQGEGGVIDMADNARTKSGDTMQGLAKWKAPKMAFRRMRDNLLRAPFHVIFCLRAKDGVRQRGKGKSAEIESTGLEPICEKEFIFEMAVSVLLGPDHKPLLKPIDRYFCNPIIPAIKAPGDLIGAIKPGEFLSETTGAAIAEWVGGGAPVDTKIEEQKRIAREVATMGRERMGQHWKSLPPHMQHALSPILDDLRATAANADAAPKPEEAPAEDPFAKPAPAQTPDEPDPLDDSFTEPEPVEREDRYTPAAG